METQRLLTEEEIEIKLQHLPKSESNIRDLGTITDEEKDCAQEWVKLSAEYCEYRQ